MRDMMWFRIFVVRRWVFKYCWAISALFLILSRVNTATLADASESVLLNQFPALSQKDPANYRDQSMLTVEDSLPGGTEKVIVPNLACAATVYTILERGRGNQQAMIDDFYPDPRKFNGNSPGAKRPTYVGRDISIDPQAIITSLKSGQSVVLHGYGGPLKEHFVLAVGFKAGADGRQILAALDPFPGNDSDKPGRQIEIELGEAPFVHPIFHDIVFREMRLVAGENKSTPPVATQGNYNVTMKDGTVLVGAIQVRTVKFSGSYGEVNVSLGDVVAFNDGFLVLGDGNKLKGNFLDSSLTLATARGEMNLPFESVTSIVKTLTPAQATSPLPVSSSPTVASSGNNAVLVGKVLDCFGRPLAGVSIEVDNSRFATTTDDQGSYSLGYVPGTIALTYSKAGYYSKNLNLQIASVATYPVQDLSLFKTLPSEGILLVGGDDYVKPLGGIQMKQVRAAPNLNQQLFGSGSEYQYFVSGQPVLLAKPDGNLMFVINVPNWDGTYDGMGGLESLVLLRVRPGGLFLRQVRVGVGITDDTFHGEEINTGTITPVNSFRMWTGHLDPGQYVFAMKHAQTVQGGYVSEPSFFFTLGNASPGTASDPVANPSGTLPTTGNTASTSAPQTPFEKLTASVPNAGLFMIHAKKYTYSYDAVWNAVSQLLTEQHEKIIESDKDKGALMTDMTRHGIIGFPSYDRYCLLIEKDGDASAKVTFKLLKYSLHFEPSQPDSFVPQNGVFVDGKAEAFLDKINKRLQTGK